MRRTRRIRKRRSRHRGGGSLLKVTYADSQVQSNEHSLQSVQSIPSVTISSGPTTLYTLIMHDPDAPGHSANRPWLHWLVTDIPGPDFSQGRPIFNYEGPRPPSGIHRYYFSLYEQQHGSLGNAVRPSAANFDLKEFVRIAGLRLVGQVFMRVGSSTS